MHQFAKPILAGGILAALYIAGATMDSRTTAARAEGGPTVTIGAPLPLPISAQQRGAWNVGIAGTPNVNIAGLPAIRLPEGASINVANPPANPVPIVDVGNTVRHDAISSAGMSRKSACGPGISPGRRS
jgi:hypothetical protein